LSGHCYYDSLKIFACHEAGMTVMLPRPMTAGAKSEGRPGKLGFLHVIRGRLWLPGR
jgi:hypothetical protein